jgi:hypothetical protein
VSSIIDARRGPNWGILADWAEHHLQGAPFGFLAPHISLSRPNRLFKAATTFSLTVSPAGLAGAAGFDEAVRGVEGRLGTAGETVLAPLATLGGIDLVGHGEVVPRSGPPASSSYKFNLHTLFAWSRGDL